MKEYYMDHPTKDDYEIMIPRKIVDEIIKDYFMKTFYWATGTLCMIIGFILGVVAR